MAADGLYTEGCKEMKFFKKMKDGGAESTVTGYWLIEAKSLFSIALLKFKGSSREAYHEHAFNCMNWLLAGYLREERVNLAADGLPSRSAGRGYWPSLKPFFIFRNDCHKVSSIGTSWVLSIRGPWTKTWKEYLPNENRVRTLTHGRKEV